MLLTVKHESFRHGRRVPAGTTRETIKASASFVQPMDGTHPAREITLYVTLHTADELQAWWKGISAAIEAAFLEPVIVTVNP